MKVGTLSKTKTKSHGLLLLNLLCFILLLKRWTIQFNGVHLVLMTTTLLKLSIKSKLGPSVWFLLLLFLLLS